jgi:N-methylhydantoinase A
LDPKTGRVAVGKRLSSNDSPVRSVIEGIKDILVAEDIAPQEIEKAIHGTTLITNLIIERKGAKTARHAKRRTLQLLVGIVNRDGHESL